ncbi:MAG: prepilin peptidase [Actinomycetota bacterium]|nr:prepilin peptidase [Actinomycetota bacterium]
MTVALVVLCALGGLLVGSFLNVVIWRVPRGESVVRPPSACPACHAPIRPRDNVPLLSWAVLRGKCRDCAKPVSVRYPAVEAGCSLLFGLLAARFGADAALPAFLYLAAVGLALAIIDIDTHRLPNALTLPAYPVALALLALALLGDHAWSQLARAALGGIALFVLYVAIRLAYPAGMGLGDVKLSGVLGLYAGWVGWGAWGVAAFLAFLYGGMFGIAQMSRGRASRKTQVPFGPFMLLGTLTGVLAGEQIWHAYLSLTAV